MRSEKSIVSIDWIFVCPHTTSARPFTDDEWDTNRNDLNRRRRRLCDSCDGRRERVAPVAAAGSTSQATIVINCMPELMKRTRAGKLDFAKLPGVRRKAPGAEGKEQGEDDLSDGGLLKSISSWIGRQAKGKGKNGATSHGRADYLKWAERLPGLLRFVPNAGRLRDAKNYLLLMSYFLQPTPNNIRSMILLALKEYVDDERLKEINVPAPEALPSSGSIIRMRRRCLNRMQSMRPGIGIEVQSPKFKVQLRTNLSLHGQRLVSS
jgi:hypothetical protein